MESLEDSNCRSMSDSFSLYERYMRSFNISDNSFVRNSEREGSEQSSNSDSESCHSRSNIDLSTAQSVVKHDLLDSNCRNQSNGDNTDALFVKADSLSSPAPSLLENSSATTEQLLTDKSNQTDVQVSSEETKRYCTQPLFITSTMENSNNAVDSVPMFRDVRPNEGVFKLPIRELSFNGTIKHVLKLKPIVDPIKALSSNKLDLDEKSADLELQSSSSENINFDSKNSDQKYSDADEPSVDENRVDKTSDRTGDSQYEELNRKEYPVSDDASSKWNLDQSHSSFEASFDSGVRSPDLFSEDGDDVVECEPTPKKEPFWTFMKDYESHDKRKLTKLEGTLEGILPPPSVTTLRTDVHDMLKKYYSNLPLFNENIGLIISEDANSRTPTKRVSFIEVPNVTHEEVPSMMSNGEGPLDNSKGQDLDTSSHDKTIDLKMCSEMEAKETPWPQLLKCRHHDVYYNVTKYSEKFERLCQQLAQRYVGAETDTSVCVHSGGFQSPNSASKRKALRLKMAQAKSPGRRLSHLARRRQAFCSAATINDKPHTSTAKMVLIDKSYFPYRKVINSAERKSPRTKRTPGKKTPKRKTPGKKTPSKTPRSGSSKKKAMKRLLLDSEMTRTQPTRETLKRALFISPDNKNVVKPIPCTSVPLQRTRRALFGSPDRTETKSCDFSMSDNFLKRKRDALDDPPDGNRCKMAKSLSFGGDTPGYGGIAISRRASEVIAKKSDLNENHKQKLLWAVSEALRTHGWRMSSRGFREKAASLARLTRRLLALPPHAARLAAHNVSTSDALLKIARLYVFPIIQGRSVEDCFQDELNKLANDVNSKMTGYISASNYQQRAKPTTSQIKENSCGKTKSDQPKSANKNVLQDKLVNINSNSNSSSLSSLDKGNMGLFMSNSMPSFEEAAKMRARRQISFDNLDFPKR